MLVRALKNKNSFNYPFDSLVTISKLYSPDSLFRIFSWHLVIDDDNVIQHGVIQMKTEDGSLSLFPLFDRSDLIKNIQDSVVDNYAWVGAIYYKIVKTEFANKNMIDQYGQSYSGKDFINAYEKYKNTNGVIDISTILRDSSIKIKYIDEFHYSPAVNKLIAKEIFTKIIKRYQNKYI